MISACRPRSTSSRRSPAASFSSQARPAPVSRRRSPLIDEINQAARHIITIEDLIEFLHQHKRCIVNQREIGDATGFADALRGALRQDPDVILLGEMRDLETISTALTAARPATSCSPPSTRRVHRAPSTASSTRSPASSRRRCACSSRTRSRASSRRRFFLAADGSGRVCRSRSSSSTTRSGT